MKQALFIFFVALAAARAEGIVYPDRWVFVARGLSSDQDVEDIRQIAATAARHGLTGVVFESAVDTLDRQPPAYFDRLRQVKGICDDLGLEIVPLLCSIGYGSGVLAHDRNLAEGLPVKDARYVFSNFTAYLVPDPPVALVNGGMEQYDAATGKVAGFNWQDGPGTISFIDTETAAEGSASLRFEGFENTSTGNARLYQTIQVQPYRSYRVSFWVKTENLRPANGIRLQVLAADGSGRALAPFNAGVPATTDWRKVTWGFNSMGYDTVRIYAGVWAGRGGRFWVDDFRIEEVGLLNVLRRPGTPVTVRLEDSDTVLEEGVDYAYIQDPRLNFRFDHDGPRIVALEGSRLKEGDRLRVSWYQGMSVNDGQVSACMSDPRVYEIFREQARRVQEALAPRRFLLSMDEIRMGGSCQACKSRGMTMAEILGDCITQEMAIVREVNPDAEIYTWSDMLDPNHNAHGEYYLVDGDYTGSWNYVPNDLGIVCWYYGKRAESLAHFSGLGMRTVAGAYYDAGSLDNPRGWLEALDRTPGASGIMYTTWQDDYGLLADFGELVSLPR